MKRFISTTLAVLMLFSVMVCSAYADDGSGQNNVVDNRKKKDTPVTDNRKNRVF